MFFILILFEISCFCPSVIFSYSMKSLKSNINSKIQTCVWTKSGFPPLCDQSRTLFEPMFDLRDRHRPHLINHKNSTIFKLDQSISQVKVSSKIQTYVWTRSGFPPLCDQSRTLFEPMFDLRDGHRPHLINHKNSHFQTRSV